jgi:hypothetical protein
MSIHRNTQVARTLAAAILGIALLSSGLQAQEQAQAQRGPNAADRKRVLEAIGKGDYAGAEKLMLELQAGLPSGAAAPAEGGSVFYEEIKACGFYPQETRLECIIEIKQTNGYAGPVGSFGSVEHVYFCIDYNNDGQFTQFESAGQGSVQMHDESAGARPPWQYAIYRDFNPFGGLGSAPGPLRTAPNGNNAPTTTNAPTKTVRAILSWFFAPTGCNFRPIWGNIVQFRIRFDPIR